MKTERYAMSDDFTTSYNEIRPELQGSILRGILGSLAGMVICTLVLLFGGVFHTGRFSIMLPKALYR